MPDAPASVRSWCLTHRHRIQLLEDPLRHAWVLQCRTCEDEDQGWRTVNSLKVDGLDYFGCKLKAGWGNGGLDDERGGGVATEKSITKRAVPRTARAEDPKKARQALGGTHDRETL